MYIKIYNNEKLDNRFFKLMEKLDEKSRKTIMLSIYHVIENYSGEPVPPTAKPLFDIGEEILNEFRISLSKILIRINYFIDYDSNCIVLLNWYEKPNGSKDSNSYNKAKKKQIDKMIKKSINTALELKKDYNNNENDYELLN